MIWQQIWIPGTKGDVGCSLVGGVVTSPPCDERASHERRRRRRLHSTSALQVTNMCILEYIVAALPLNLIWTYIHNCCSCILLWAIHRMLPKNIDCTSPNLKMRFCSNDHLASRNCDGSTKLVNQLCFKRQATSKRRQLRPMPPCRQTFSLILFRNFALQCSTS